MSDELKPVRCGCGGEAKVEPLPFETWNDIWDASASQYFVRCDRCGMTTRLHDTEAEAVEAWNRAMSENVPTAKVTTVEKPIEGSVRTISVMACENCENVVSIFDNYCSGCGARLEWE